MKYAPLVFTVDCDERHFFWVQIHPDEASMIRAIRELRGRPDKTDSDLRACTLRYVRTEGKKILPELGVIFFVRGDIPNGAVVHEMTHAAIYWARRVKIDPTKSSKRYSQCPEERFAYTLQSLVEQFDRKCPWDLRLPHAVAA